MHKILYRGAESVIYLDNQTIVKERIKKSYRISQIDEKLRRERTRKEVKLLMDARAFGVMTPKILQVGEKKIIMEYIKGKRVKELLESSNKSTAKICQNIGRLVGKLHENNIIHGDLTTSNMIKNGKKIYLLDFSLGDVSRKIEDKGTDMKLLRDAIKSTHFKIFKNCWENIVKGCREEYKDAGKVLEKVEEIERRARYREHE